MLDPTPASRADFFGGYRSRAVSRWLHFAAAKWSQLYDAILESELGRNLLIFSSLLILACLFVREKSVSKLEL